MFDNRAIDEFLSRLFAAPGRTNDFRKLPRKLFLVATNLDTGGPVVFGSREHAHVPISRAIEASSALPGLFPPVAIDGAHYVDGALNKTLHASVALDEGIALLLCINPLVPFDASSAQVQGRAPDRLNKGGLPLVLGQTFRAIIHSRMRVGMESYRARYPDAGIVLFEPDREDADMFFANIFSYCAAQAPVRNRVRQDAPKPRRARAIARARLRHARHRDPPGPARRPAAPHPRRAGRPAPAARATGAGHRQAHRARARAYARPARARRRGRALIEKRMRKPPRRTRERILETSLALMNREGEPHVTTADIADEMNISPGNLYYHFRNKDDIIGELYDAYERTVAPLLATPPAAEVEDLWFLLHLLFERMHEYRFLYRDLDEITSRNRKLARARGRLPPPARKHRARVVAQPRAHRTDARERA